MLLRIEGQIIIQQQHFDPPMSLFLLPEDQAITCIHKFLQAKRPRLTPQTDNSRKVEELMGGEVKRQREFALSVCTAGPTGRRHSLLLTGLAGGLKGVFELQMHRQSQEVRLRMQLLDCNDRYFMAANRHLAVQITRNAAHHSAHARAHLVKLAVNMLTGQVKFQLPFHALAPQDLLNPALDRQADGRLFHIFRLYIQPHLPLLEHTLLPLVAPEGSSELPLDRPFHRKILDNVYRYSEMLMVSSHLSECHIETEQQVNEKERLRKESVEKLMGSRQEVGREVKAVAGMFCTPGREVSLREEKDYEISSDELRFIRSMVAMPVQPKSKNPYQNSMVMNHIFIHEAGGAQMSRVSQGGFASILLTELKYWYVYSSEGHEFMSLNQFENKSPKNMLHKFVAVKRELEGVERGGKGEGGRNRHEMKILNKIKNGSSIFLAKYYIPINKPNPFGEAILMDYIPFKNLGDYLRSTRLSLSLLSRLYLMFSMVQALRYLRDYRIVHLDLKPNNIMIFCNMLVKLIDFGESYHPEVCHAPHRPGFTLPYSCPELFTPDPHFTSKSDVFSIGVIFYEMLYARHPFDITKNTTLLDSAMQQYLSYWYFAPEEFEAYGDCTVLRILNALISKCLAVEAEDRPELDWIALVIRQCFELLH